MLIYRAKITPSENSRTALFFSEPEAGGGIRIFPALTNSPSPIEALKLEPFSDRLEGEIGLRVAFNYGRAPIDLGDEAADVFRALGLKMPKRNEPKGGVALLDFMRIFQDGALSSQSVEISFAFLIAEPLEKS